jgi:hypothetical protein
LTLKLKLSQDKDRIVIEIVREQGEYLTYMRAYKLI